MSTKALVLSSGGLDSTTALGLAVKNFGSQNVITASLFYGQRHSKELESARKVAQFYGVNHIEDDISSVMKYSGEVCSLLSSSTKEIPMMSYADQMQKSGQGRVSTYVPFRNGLFLSIAAAYADSLFPHEDVDVFYGAHADDAAGEAYADCSPAFANAMSDAISIGTYGKVHVVRPFIEMTKADIVKLGIELKVPYELTWSCYSGSERPCGHCGTCIDRAKAFEINGIEDPALTKED